MQKFCKECARKMKQPYLLSRKKGRSKWEIPLGAKPHFAHLVESYNYTNIAYRECMPGM